MRAPDTLNRRQMLAVSSAAISSAAVPWVSRAAAPGRAALKTVSLGLAADVHQDVIHDGRERISEFVREMKRREVDAVVQLGDFSLPHSHNQPFLDTWNTFSVPKYHVLGNHDTDHGFSKRQTMAWWGMESRYYSFDLGGWHFVVLDGNDKNPGKWSGYVRYVAQDQREWLAADLAATTAPTILFSHQKLESDGGVANSGEVRGVLEQANRDAGWQKVIACFCGHHHTDGMTEIAGIRYIHVNSMAYKWIGRAHKRQRYPDHIERAHPHLSHTFPYRDPLYTVLTLNPDHGTLEMSGMQTEFVPPTPSEVGVENAAEMLPVVSERKLKVLE